MKNKIIKIFLETKKKKRGVGIMNSFRFSLFQALLNYLPSFKIKETLVFGRG
jgi:hypothetical protein